MMQAVEVKPKEGLQPHWISDQAGLHRLCADLRECRRVAMDTESNSLFAYRERVCLVQISSNREDFLIDPLELDDLGCLVPVMADPAVEKIFHAAEYDIICLKRDYGMEFKTIFDTMQAARILGVREVGLGAILESEFGVKQDKRNQRANWGQRPLPIQMLDYACQDTRYLIPLRDRLAERLNERGLMGLAMEDFARLCKVKAAGVEEREPCWRISGSQGLDGRERAILAELCEMRESLASTSDRPPFKILPNECLTALAKAKPKVKEDLEGIPGLSPRLIDRYSRDILAAVEKGRSATPIPKPPRSPRPDQAFLDRLERLKTWRREAGKKMEVESDIILPRDILEAVVSRDPQDISDLKKVMVDVPWRWEHYGGEILTASLGNKEKNT